MSFLIKPPIAATFKFSSSAGWNGWFTAMIVNVIYQLITVVSRSVEENEYDEDGEFEKYVGTWDWSRMEIDVTIMPSYDVIGTYSTMRDAQEAANSYGGEYENIKIL